MFLSVKDKPAREISVAGGSRTSMRLLLSHFGTQRTDAAVKSKATDMGTSVAGKSEGIERLA